MRIWFEHGLNMVSTQLHLIKCYRETALPLCYLALVYPINVLRKDGVFPLARRFPDAVPRPPHWGGYCIVPQEIEFWADGEHRLHDRFRFTCNAASGWDVQRLNP